MRTGFWIRTLIGLAIGAFFIWLSARDWPMDQLTGAVSISEGHLVVGDAVVPQDGANGAASGASTMSADGSSGARGGWVFDLWWILPYMLSLTVIHFLRVIRWKPLLDPIIELDFKTHNRIGAVGFMAMFLFPLRLGELVRPYLVKKGSGKKVRMSPVLATVAVERIADGLMVSLMLFAVLAFLPSANGEVSTELTIGALGALGIFVAATVLLVGARWQHDRTVAFIRGTAGRVSTKVADKIIDILDAFIGGLKLMPSTGAFVWFLVLTATYWVINGVATWMMAKAFYLPVDMLGAYAMMCCVVVGMMIPNSPGNVGSFWYFLVVPLPLYGVSTGNTQAVAFGITVWFFQLIQQTAFGAWFIIRGDVSMARLMEATQESEDSLSDGEDGPGGPSVQPEAAAATGR